jgi:hypothetical protein
MTTRRVSTWLPGIIGPVNILADGDEITPAKTLNLVGATATTTGDQVDIEFPGSDNEGGQTLTLASAAGPVAANTALTRSTVQAGRYLPATPANLALSGYEIVAVTLEAGTSDSVVRVTSKGVIDLAPGAQSGLTLDSSGVVTRSNLGRSVGWATGAGPAVFNAPGQIVAPVDALAPYAYGASENDSSAGGRTATLAAIQATIDAADFDSYYNIGRRSIRIPGGTSYVDGAIQYRNRVNIIGDGGGAESGPTDIRVPNASDGFIFYSNNAPLTGTSDWASLRDITIANEGNTGTFTATINGATNASPIVIQTSSAHGFQTGNDVDIKGVQGNTAANGRWAIEVVDSTHFRLLGSTGSGAYTTGGTAIHQNAGARIKSIARLEHVGFGGFYNGVRIDGGTGVPQGFNTTADFGHYSCVRVAGGRGYAFHVEDGGDNNANVFINCDARNVGSFGDPAIGGDFYDSSFLGNLYLGCSSNSESGVYKVKCTGGANATSWVGCYYEGGEMPLVLAPATVVGNNLAGMVVRYPLNTAAVFSGYGCKNVFATYYTFDNPEWTAGETLSVGQIRRPTALRGPITITGATNAAPIEITAASHGFPTGATVVIASVTGNTAANGTWTVTRTGTNTFTLDNSVGNGAYSSGGTATREAHNGRDYKVDSITTGVTGTVEPAWPATNYGVTATVVDNGVTWIENGPTLTTKAATAWLDYQQGDGIFLALAKSSLGHGPQGYYWSNNVSGARDNFWAMTHSDSPTSWEYMISTAANAESHNYTGRGVFWVKQLKMGLPYSGEVFIDVDGAPVNSGARYRGDVRVNVVAGKGSPAFWQCVTAGTPGTWGAVLVDDVQHGYSPQPTSDWANSAMTDGTTLTVTGATNASPIVITTSASHKLMTGQRVVVSSVGGNTAANGTWTITALSDTTFSLTGSTGSGAYTSGGSVVLETYSATKSKVRNRRLGATTTTATASQVLDSGAIFGGQDLTLAEGDVVLAACVLVGKRNGQNEATAIELKGLFTREGGTVAAIGSPTATVVFESGANITGTTAALVANNTAKTIEVQVSPANAITIDWSVIRQDFTRVE